MGKLYYSVGAFLCHDDQILNNKEYISKITSVYGSLPCKFQSGRCMEHLKNTSLDFVADQIKKYNSNSISVYLTFSRYNLTNEDLKDETSNSLLKLIVENHSQNGVIISSDLLYDYIKNKYPDLVIISSILKPTYESNSWVMDNPDYYNRLCEKYDFVTINPAKVIDENFYNDLAFPKKIIKDYNFKEF